MSNIVCIPGYKVDKDGNCVEDERYSMLVSVIKNGGVDKDLAQSFIESTSQNLVKDVLKNNNIPIPDSETIKQLVSAKSLEDVKKIPIPPSVTKYLENVKNNNFYLRNASKAYDVVSKFM